LTKLNNKTESKISNTEKIKPQLVFNKHSKETDNSIFMDHINEYDDDNVWYIDGNTVDQMTNHSEWFD